MPDAAGSNILLVRWGANAIKSAFDDYHRDFRTVTLRAKKRFETCDWPGHQRDALLRLGLISERTWHTMLRLRTQFGSMVHDHSLWVQMKSLYADAVRGHPAEELAETFFNSVTRRVFGTVGVDRAIEFVLTEREQGPDDPNIYTTHPRTGSTEDLVRAVLSQFPWESPYRSFEEDVREAARRVDIHFSELGAGGPVEAVDMLSAVFYRGKGAYLIGRARRGEDVTPFIFAMLHEADGIFVDALLMGHKDARVLFSFTRSYFHVEVERPRSLVDFIRTILPMRRPSELYIAIGQNKHGKTELFREIIGHVQRTQERFEPAAGDRGMVMIVFTLPSLELVFKVIRDHIPPPKSTSRAEVKQKYNLVFRQDRAGRLVDAQEFEHLEFDRARFDPRVLDELLRDAPSQIRVQGERVEIQHLYVERRVRPLNLHLREAPLQAQLDAVLDYGRAIKDLAATNTFPGDLLLKNFGVTRNGRVIFYDYDEMSLVTECRFRDLPTPRDDDEMGASEPWFFVDKDDIFPEEFLKFLGFTPEQEAAFLETHRDLLTAQFWRDIQQRLEAGEIVDIFPYLQNRRFKVPSSTPR